VRIQLRSPRSIAALILEVPFRKTRANYLGTWEAEGSSELDWDLSPTFMSLSAVFRWGFTSPLHLHECERECAGKMRGQSETNGKMVLGRHHGAM
jgi:hypothetical protein